MSPDIVRNANTPSAPERRRRSTGRRPRPAAVLVVALLPAGLVSGMGAAANAVPAAARTVVTPYAFSATGYGSTVSADQVALSSGPTGYSIIGCTKAAGRSTSNTLAALNGNDQVKVQAVASHNYTFHRASGSAGVSSLTTIAQVDLGNSTLGLRLTGLRGFSTAYARPNHTFNANSTFTLAGLTPTGSGASALPGPLKDLLNGPTATLVSKINSGAPIVIPGFGTLKGGHVAKHVGSAVAQSGSIGLEVDLYGPDGLAGGGDDSVVLLGRSYARISRSATRGVFAGSAHAVDATALNGVATVGPQLNSPLACEGTAGVVRTTSAAGLNLANLNQLVTGVASNRVYGKQDTPRGGLTGFTESTVAHLNLGGGQLTVDGIMSRARVIRSAAGHLYRYPVQRVLGIRAGGKAYPAPKPGQSVTIPMVATLSVPTPTRTTYGLQVVALRVRLLGGSAANTVVNLGVSRTEIRKY